MGKEGVVTVKPKSLLVCYTDGVVETENESEEYFGMQRLTMLLRKSQGNTPKEINKELIDSIVNFKGSKTYADDIAIFTGKLY